MGRNARVRQYRHKCFKLFYTSFIFSRELASSKVSSGSRRKSSPSTSNLSKQLDQRKRVSPSSSAPSVILTKSLPSGSVASAFKVKQEIVCKEVDAISDSQDGEDISSAQIEAPLSVRESQIRASVFGHELLGATLGEEERMKIVLGGGGHIAEALCKEQVGAVASEGSVNTVLAGGVVKSALCGSQDQVRAVVSCMGLSGVDLLAGKMVKLETSAVKMVASTPPVISSKPVTPLSLTPPFSKMLVDVTSIKKEPSSSVFPNPMDLTENPTPRLLTTPPKEEKIWLPMHTPQPSTHGTHVPAEMHVIIQQPNAAAMLVQENLRKVSIPISHQSSVAMFPTSSITTGISCSTATSGLPNSCLTVAGVSISSGFSPSLGSSAFTPVSKMTCVPVAGTIVRSVSVSRPSVVIPREVAMAASSSPTDSIFGISKRSPVIVGKATGMSSLPVSNLTSLKAQLTTAGMSTLPVSDLTSLKAQLTSAGISTLPMSDLTSLKAQLTTAGMSSLPVSDLTSLKAQLTTAGMSTLPVSDLTSLKAQLTTAGMSTLPVSDLTSLKAQLTTAGMSSLPVSDLTSLKAQLTTAGLSSLPVSNLTNLKAQLTTAGISTLPVSDLTSLKAQLTTPPAPAKPFLAGGTPPTLPLLPKAAPNSLPTISPIKCPPTTGVLVSSRLLASLSPIAIPTVPLVVAAPTITESTPPTFSGLAASSSSLPVSSIQPVCTQKTVAHGKKNVSTLIEGVSFVGGSDMDVCTLIAATDAVPKTTMTRALSATNTLANTSCSMSNVTAVSLRSAGLTVPSALNPVSSHASVSIPVSVLQTSVPLPTHAWTPALIPTCVSTPCLTSHSVLNLVPIPVPVQIPASISALVPTISSVSPSVPSAVPIPVSTPSLLPTAPVSSLSVQQQQTSLVAATGAKCQSDTEEVSKEIAKPEGSVAKADLLDTEDSVAKADLLDTEGTM